MVCVCRQWNLHVAVCSTPRITAVNLSPVGKLMYTDLKFMNNSLTCFMHYLTNRTPNKWAILRYSEGVANIYSITATRLSTNTASSCWCWPSELMAVNCDRDNQMLLYSPQKFSLQSWGLKRFNITSSHHVDNLTNIHTLLAFLLKRNETAAWNSIVNTMKEAFLLALQRRQACKERFGTVSSILHKIHQW